MQNKFNPISKFFEMNNFNYFTMSKLTDKTHQLIEDIQFQKINKTDGTYAHLRIFYLKNKILLYEVITYCSNIFLIREEAEYFILNLKLEDYVQVPLCPRFEK